MKTNRPQIILKKGKERSVLNRHPWIFSGAIAQEPKGLVDGTTVDVMGSDMQYLGTGHFHKGSITVRILSFDEISSGNGYWTHMIEKACALRKSIGITHSEQTNVYRLVNAEGDGMPGLIIDFYNGTAVIHTHTEGMFRERQNIVTALTSVLGEQLISVYDKSGSVIRQHAGIETENSNLVGDLKSGKVTENGHQFHVNWEEGQKTGFFIDQRDNRQVVGNLSAGKKVLNTYCYSGGFSVYALAGGAKSVVSVDSSAKAIKWTNQNIGLNKSGGEHTSICADVNDFLKDIDPDYDLIVLDPPAFAKRLSAVDQAVTGYRKINSKAISRIAPGGTLVTFSCSQAIDRNLFKKVIFQAAAETGRNVRITGQLSQPADHPISIYHPEGEYLKGLVLYVE
jgi:23S rRNA (cytosine1962-C5)-methyltransferase